MDRYAIVPAALPPVLPPITRVDAQRIATMIYRQFYPGVGHSASTHPERHYTYPEGRVRRVWISSKPTTADNHSKGLGRLIHDLSHRVFRATYPHKRPHDPLHVRYETDVAAYVAASSWLKRLTTPKPERPPKPAPTAADKRAAELAKVEAAIKRWTTKAKRAETALKKLARRRKRLLHALAD